MKTTRIAVLAYEACFGAELFGLADVLQMANRVAAQLETPAGMPFQVTIIGASARPARLAGGLQIEVGRKRGPVDLLVVPGFDFEAPAALGARLAALRPEAELIRRVFARGVPVASICVGAFLLGEAGLLNRRHVTTAWAFAPMLAKRYPTARVEPSALILRDGGVTTCAAFSAAFDLAMHLVRQHAPPQVATRTSKLTLISGTRDSQAPYADTTVVPSEGTPFSQAVMAYLQRRLREPYDLHRLAKAFHVSTRTLLRRFRAETGRSPLEVLQADRIARAKTLLESTTLSVGEVMVEIGYGDLSTFRRLFLARVGTSPARYRRQFRRPELE